MRAQRSAIVSCPDFLFQFLMNDVMMMVMMVMIDNWLLYCRNGEMFVIVLKAE